MDSNDIINIVDKGKITISLPDAVTPSYIESKAK